MTGNVGGVGPGDPDEGQGRSTAVFASSGDQGRKRWVFAVGVIGLAVALVAVATVAPPATARKAGVAVPAPDAVIAKVGPRDAARREAEARAAAGDLAAAVVIARDEIAASRRTGDPRHLGRAQAALDRWWDDPAPPDEVLLLRATVRQALHDFPGARADLDALIARRPDDAQARLTRAVVAGVVGDRTAARADCAAAGARAGELVGAACRAPLASARGEGRAAYERLEALLAAERHFRAALAAAPDDLYTLAALADLLLDTDRAAEVVTLLADRTADNLVLRHVIALGRTGSPGFAAAADALRARIAASVARGDTLHLRERARFYLEVERAPAAAVEAATANWRIQREAADARVLLEAAAAARDRQAAAPVIAWLDAERIDDAVLAKARRAVEALP